jgi:hypothetical protein
MDPNIYYNKLNHLHIKLDQKAPEQTPLTSIVTDLISVATVNHVRVTST